MGLAPREIIGKASGKVKLGSKAHILPKTADVRGILPSLYHSAKLRRGGYVYHLETGMQLFQNCNQVT